MENRPLLSGLLWRAALWFAFIVLAIAVVYTLSILSQPITIG